MDVSWSVRHMTHEHAFEAYAAKEGHYPRFRMGDYTVSVHPGYVTFGHRLHDTYIPKDVLIPLLRWLFPLAKRMGPSFDPESAMSDYLEFLDENEKALRRQKGPRRKLGRI